MSERLVIKNFGPIKHVDLEIKKVNVLIGDQGTGKSTVAKVLAIFRDSDFHIISESLTYMDYFIDYSINAYFKEDTYFSYNCNSFNLEYINGKFDIKYNKLLGSLINDLENTLNSYNDENSDIKYTHYKEISHLIDNEFSEDVIYIPAERVLISIILNSSFSFFKNKISLPQYLNSFGEDYEIARTERGARQKIDFLDIEYFNNNGFDTIYNKSFGILKLTESATGYLSSVPLYLVVDSYSSDHTTIPNNTAFYIVEEPEISLFPQTQHRLIQFLISKTILNDKYLLTTHSPYILSSLNNLMFAYQVGSKDNNAEKVAEILDKKYWLNPDDVSAYMLTTDGTAENIIAKDGLIKTEKIDSVSSVLNEEFDKIFNIDLGIKNEKNI